MLVKNNFHYICSINSQFNTFDMERITAEFTTEEKKEIRIAAAKAGLKSVREWVRQEIVKIIKNQQNEHR